MRGWDDVVSTGTDGQAPYFTMVSLSNKAQKPKVRKHDKASEQMFSSIIVFTEA